jgi:tetratricopeptide (TPR) repeat protein
MKIRNIISTLALLTMPTLLLAQSAAVVNANAEGNRAFAAHRYDEALRMFQQALKLAIDVGDKQYEAIATFGVARSYGQLCAVDQAERAFQKSIALREGVPDQKYSYMTQNLLEFARFLMAQNRFSDAVPLIDKAIPLLDRLDVAKSDPIGYAELLDDYQTALKSAGRNQEASDIAAKADAFRQGNPGKRARFKPDRYPSNCTR